MLEGTTPNNLTLVNAPKEPETPDATPGFGQKLTSLHPALAVRDLRDESLTLRISGMALRGPRELLFTTWDGDLFSLDLAAIPNQGAPPFRRIAQGLAEPMGLTISNGRVFVTEKNEATELIDEDGDGLFETYRCVSHDWPCTMDYHEYLFGAVVRDSHLYFSSSVGMTSRDKDNRQAPLRGSVLKVHVDSGKTEVVAGGLRTPDGIGLGPRGSFLVTDNQGEWLPASKLIAVQSDAFYQFRKPCPMASAGSIATDTSRSVAAAGRDCQIRPPSRSWCPRTGGLTRAKSSSATPRSAVYNVLASTRWTASLKEPCFRFRSRFSASVSPL